MAVSTYMIHALYIPLGYNRTEDGFCRFPLGSEDTGDITLPDQAIEHFGISTNLLEFHPIPSRCGPTTESSESPFPNGTEPSDSSTTSSEEAKAQETTDSFDEDDEIDVASPTIAPKASATGRPNGNFWTPRNSSHHPFIVTRSQLVVIDETRPFNLTAFNDAYKRMKMSHVGSRLFSIPPENTPPTCKYTCTNESQRLERSVPTHSNLPISDRGKSGVSVDTQRMDTGTCE